MSADNVPLKEIEIPISTIETIDQALFDAIDEKMNVFAQTNKGWEKVPVIWLGAERAHQIKDNRDLRNSQGFLKLPIVTIERTAIAKDPTKKGSIWAAAPEVADNKGGAITVARRIKQDKTANFVNAEVHRKRGPIGKQTVGHGQFNFPTKSTKVVYETVTIPIPVYLDVTYVLTLRTEYQQQMNEILTPFVTMPGNINYFIAGKHNHRYECFIQPDFSQENNMASMEEEERIYKTTVEIKVLGYVFSDDKNEQGPKIVVRENIVEVKIPRERAITQDEQEHLEEGRTNINEDGFYRD